jgi:N-acetylglucosamine-6-phosphate deacetylase
MRSGEVQGKHIETGQPIRLRWTDGIITAIAPMAEAPRDLWIAPPLFDLQVNGFAGIDFQQDDLTGLELLAAVRALRAAGCPIFLLTLITDDWPRMLERLRRIRKLRAESEELEHAIVGWHIEGPFLSDQPGFCGAHNPKMMRDPTPRRIEELRGICSHDPVLLTVAPERSDAITSIERAVALGIHVSLGHTDATSKRLAQAIKAGATAFTHLGNGCPRDLNRHDNILWRIFETTEIFVSLIPDGIHVNGALFRIAHRLLGSDRICFVSDAMSAAGAPPGQYPLGNLLLEVGEDEVVRLPGSPNFAGSALTPLDGILRAASMLQCPWREVWRQYSTNPVRLMNLDYGLRIGAPATFCVLEAVSEPMNVISQVEVYARGQRFAAPI